MIRKNAPRAVILVGPNFSTRIEDAIKDPLDFDHIHSRTYIFTSYSQGDTQALNSAKEKGIGILFPNRVGQRI